jgi:simple sugar transport system ATP-binding protein
MQVEIRHIHKQFGATRANNDISATFGAGRIIGVLGENGAGKSTLMKILSGYQRPDSGQVLLDGRRAEYHDPRGAIASGIGMLQQDPLDIAAFSALENFTYGGPLMRRDAARARLEALCAQLGFSLDPASPVSALSIAQRQQLEIARLLALDIRVLILDEPTTGISAEQKATLFAALRALAQRDGLTILLVSHKLEDVIALCHEVIVLRAGRLVGALAMPATSAQLIALMFGAEPSAPARRKRMLRGDDAPAVRLDGVRLAQGRVTVSDFSLELQPGEVVGLAGLEGSGQELGLRACAGLIRPELGRVWVNDAEMTRRPYRDFLARGVAFAAAGRVEEGLVAGLSIAEHIALARGRGPLVDWRAAHREAEAQIARYQVRGTPERRVETLSGGNQQRVLLALLPDAPTALILEQPTRGLDVDSARWIWEQLEAKRAAGCAILFSSAELDEILAYSDRIIVFFAGQPHVVDDPASATAESLGALMGGRSA